MSCKAFFDFFKLQRDSSGETPVHTSLRTTNEVLASRFRLLTTPAVPDDRDKPRLANADKEEAKHLGVAVAVSLAALLSCTFSSSAQVSHMKNEMIGGSPEKVSEHVWTVQGYPNIGFVVGDRATLVVDTGLGRQNGAKAARIAERLAPKNHKLFLTTTHFHPEHVSGEQGFPAGTVVIRDAAQQAEFTAHGQEMIALFRSMSAKNRTLLAGAEPTTPDVIFDRNMTLDLGGGVKVLLLWFGAAHTKGDELIFVETDRTLISGDVVQTRTVPFIFGEGGTPTSWLAVLDKILALNVAHVLPDHSEPGDGSLVATERNLITTLQSRALELKHRGVSVEDAGRQITAEMDREFPERSDNNATEFVKRVYADPSTP